ncbi:hypothetical protein BDV06DRAFT_129215 [Aspergillus oleicola]
MAAVVWRIGDVPQGAGHGKHIRARSPNNLEPKRYLAWVYEQQGKIEAAETTHKRALAGYERKLGVGHFETLDQVVRYAEFLTNQERWKDVENVFRRNLLSYEKMFGPGGLFTGPTSWCLKSVLQAQEKPPKPCKRDLLSKIFRCRRRDEK